MNTAKPVGSEFPLGFVMDLRDEPWDGSGGLEITHRWDGMGMKATQSHRVMLDGIAGEPFAWPESLAVSGPTSGVLGLSTYVVVIVAVVDEVMAEAARRLDGLLRSLSTAVPEESLVAVMHAKLGIAETLVGQISRAVGGSAFSASSPFASWYEDVRALSFLGPSWGLAFGGFSSSVGALSDLEIDGA